MRRLLAQSFLISFLLGSSTAAFAQDFDPLLTDPDFGGAFPTGPVKKLGDGELTCNQLYAEVSDLEKTIVQRQSEYEALMTKVSQSARDMAAAARGAGGATGAINTITGLAGLIPGAGFIAGTVGSLASSAAQDAQFNAIDAQMAEMEATQGQLMKLGGELGTATARREHLTELFLKKDCKVSELQAPTPQPSPNKPPSLLKPRNSF